MKYRRFFKRKFVPATLNLQALMKGMVISMYVSINGTLISTDDAFVSAMGEGYNYGFGLFETLKIVNGNIIFLKEHVNRLEKGCIDLDLQFEYNEATLQGYAKDLLLSNHITNGSLKILYAKNKEQYSLLITTNENKYTEDLYKKGYQICFAAGKRNPHTKLTYIKSNNYLENLLEKTKANKMGYEEAIYSNTEGFLSEGTYTNIFFVKNNKVFTPSITCGLLPGIMRDKVIEIIQKHSIKLEVGQFQKENLLEADEIFLTNSLMEIMPVMKLVDRNLSLERNPITQRLRKYILEIYNIDQNKR